MSAWADKLAHLAGIALFLVVGAAIADLVPWLRGRGLAVRVALGYLLGVAWMATALFVASLLLHVPLRRPLVLVAAAVPLVVRGARRLATGAVPHAATVPPARDGERLLVRIVVVVAACIAAGVLAQVWAKPLVDFDGVMTWVPAGRWMRADTTVLPTVVRSDGWFVTHPWYPPLMPLVQVTVLELTASPEQGEAFRGAYAAFFAVWLVIVHALARRVAPPRAAGLALLAAAVLPLPAGEQAGGAASAYSDLPLASFAGAALLVLLDDAGDRKSRWIGGALLAAATLTKTEGLLVALATVAVTVLLVRAATEESRGSRWLASARRCVPALLPVLAAAALLAAWGAHAPAHAGAAVTDDAARAFELPLGGRWLHQLLAWIGLLRRNLAQVPALLVAMRRDMILLERWGFFFSTAPLVLLAGRRGLRGRAVVACALVVAATLGLGALGCLVFPRPSALVAMTWSRVLLQASVPLLALFAAALGDLLPRVGAR